MGPWTLPIYGIDSQPRFSPGTFYKTSNGLTCMYNISALCKTEEYQYNGSLELFHKNLNWVRGHYPIHLIDLQPRVSSGKFYKTLNALTFMYNICELCMLN